MAETKPFTKYVAESKTDYNYVLKFAINEMPDGTIDMLETCLQKYDLKSASAFRKTPIQESPLDFPNVKNTSVFICNLTLGYPGSLDFLRTYICSNLGIPLSQLAVYSENDPRQIETDLYIDRSSPEYKEKYKTRLGSDPEETGNKDLYGGKYTIDFLKELEKVRKERKETVIINPLSQLQTTDYSGLGAGYDCFNDAKNMPTDDVGLFGRVKKPTFVKAGIL